MPPSRHYNPIMDNLMVDSVDIRIEKYSNGILLIVEGRIDGEYLERVSEVYNDKEEAYQRALSLLGTSSVWAKD